MILCAFILIQDTLPIHDDVLDDARRTSGIGAYNPSGPNVDEVRNIRIDDILNVRVRLGLREVRSIFQIELDNSIVRDRGGAVLRPDFRPRMDLSSVRTQ